MPNVNSNIIYQAGTLLADVVQQATGRKVLTANTPGEWASVAQSAISAGVEPILNTLVNMWSRTIFSVRPYSAKLKGLEMSADRFGLMTRKLSPVVKDPGDDAAYLWPVAYDAGQTPPSGDGYSVDMYAISKKQVLQTGFAGAAVYQEIFTIFKDQLDGAFRSPEEFMAFNEMQMADRSNSIESWKENIKRSLLANMILSLNAENQTGRVVHLVTEYNADTGASLTSTTVFAPANFPSFVRWLVARINTIARFMSERTAMFQTAISGQYVLRHTPAEDLRVYLTGRFKDMMDTMALSVTFNDQYLKMADVEGINFWQSTSAPASVTGKPTYTNTSGVATTPATASTVANIVGVMFDRDALGMASILEESALTPYNVKGRYWNNAYNNKFKTRFDMTEKAVLLLLD
ncbi:MAG: hypothetical protein IIZ93_16175 [Acidaminococcaceae bacterium]|nr:hypothetical protein [Acidaminococcaceae bacterium]